MDIDLRATLHHAFRRTESVTSRQLQLALGISRQAVWSRVRPLIDSGELVLVGTGRGQRYAPGPGFATAGVVRGIDDPSGFWTAVRRHAPNLAYVAVLSATRGTRLAHHARALIHGIEWNYFVVLDFRGVSTIGDAFADVLYRELLHPDSLSWATVINASPEVLARLAHARHRFRPDPRSADSSPDVEQARADRGGAPSTDAALPRALHESRGHRAPREPDEPPLDE